MGGRGTASFTITAASHLDMLQCHLADIQRATQAKEIQLVSQETTISSQHEPFVVSPTFKVHLTAFEAASDPETQRKLEREQKRIQQQIEHVETLLASPNFLEKAPAHVVQQTRDRLRQLKASLQQQQHPMASTKGQSVVRQA